MVEAVNVRNLAVARVRQVAPPNVKAMGVVVDVGWRAVRSLRKVQLFGVLHMVAGGDAVKLAVRSRHKELRIDVRHTEEGNVVLRKTVAKAGFVGWKVARFGCMLYFMRSKVG